jgi:phosphoribosylanthranilate isomerase
MMPVAIKICGLRELADVDACIALGVQMIGFNFWPKSRRRVAEDVARRLVRRLPPTIEPVGVFVDAEPEEVARTVERVGLHAVQLHGSEDPEAYRDVGARVIQVVRVKPGTPLPVAVAGAAERVLLDAWVEGHGGAGVRFDWDVVPRARDQLARPIILAGGLTPDNVAEAILRARPWGVDVASGVESEPGVKDHRKLRAFVEAVREAEKGLAS